MGGANLGMTRDDVARILDAVAVCHRLGVAPSAPNIVSVESGYPLETVEAMLGTDWVRAAAAERGLALTSQEQLSARQLAALAVYVDGGIKAGHAARLRLAGVAPAVWDAWLLNPRFADRLSALAEDRLRQAGPMALARLTDAVDDGQKWAIELTLEMSGRHDRRQGAADLPALFRSIIGILDEEVAVLPGGESALARIAEKLSTVVEQRQLTPARRIAS